MIAAKWAKKLCNEKQVVSAIRSRVRSGMENARAKGKRIGRPPVSEATIPDSFYRYYSKFQSGDITVSELSRLTKLSRATVCRYINALEGAK